MTTPSLKLRQSEIEDSKVQYCNRECNHDRSIGETGRYRRLNVLSRLGLNDTWRYRRF